MIVCKSCRRYGVPLTDGLCGLCISAGLGSTVKEGLQPRKLDYNMLDPKTGHIRYDLRTTIKTGVKVKIP